MNIRLEIAKRLAPIAVPAIHEIPVALPMPEVITLPLKRP
ncbi:hypothetical protein LCGC14_0365740 [marine sediment metagenome]|uniref:Uncharacterized protein n=1 Tax=marine sediment metagenome TaxID=412755 RepID=A0A0F9TPN5_9ZZZZ